MSQEIVKTYEVLLNHSEYPAAQEFSLPQDAKVLDAFVGYEGRVVLVAQHDSLAPQGKIVLYLLRDGDVVGPGLTFVATVAGPPPTLVRNVFVAPADPAHLRDVNRLL